MSIPAKKGPKKPTKPFAPSNPETLSVTLPGMDEDVNKLYHLIWKRFVACQMPPAEFTSTSITVQAAEYHMRARGRVMRFDGHTRVLPPLSKNEEDAILPEVKEGETLHLQKLDPIQHFTKPMPRFSEASLVKELEKNGHWAPFNLRLHYLHYPRTRLCGIAT